MSLYSTLRRRLLETSKTAAGMPRNLSEDCRVQDTCPDKHILDPKNSVHRTLEANDLEGGSLRVTEREWERIRYTDRNHGHSMPRAGSSEFQHNSNSPAFAITGWKFRNNCGFDLHKSVQIASHSTWTPRGLLSLHRSHA